MMGPWVRSDAVRRFRSMGVPPMIPSHSMGILPMIAFRSMGILPMILVCSDAARRSGPRYRICAKRSVRQAKLAPSSRYPILPGQRVADRPE
jgi:hypothetical protein